MWKANLWSLGKGDALIIVDMQKDFLPGGTLAVKGGDEIVPLLNRCIGRFVRRGLPIVATCDWHPRDHCSFVKQGGTWPAHCIAGTSGAAFAPGLELPEDVMVVGKATQPDKDAYSGFAETGLAPSLHRRGITRVFVGGLATDYCVLNTVRDALAAGFQVVLLRDAIRAVDLKPGDGQRAIDEMTRLGAVPVSEAALAA